MRKHHLFVLSVLVVTLTTLALASQAAAAARSLRHGRRGHGALLRAPGTRWRASTLALRQAPLPFLTAIARSARLAVALSAPRRAPARYVPAGGPWLALRECESGDNYSINTGNGYYGAYQFTAATWWSLGFTGLPSDAPPSQQDLAARVLQARAGWGAWPACSVMLGLR